MWSYFVRDSVEFTEFHFLETGQTNCKVHCHVAEGWRQFGNEPTICTLPLYESNSIPTVVTVAGTCFVCGFLPISFIETAPFEMESDSAILAEKTEAVVLTCASHRAVRFHLHSCEPF